MRSFLAALLLCFAIPASQAALVNNGSFTTDTVTGLDWLDLTETNGFSYNYVSTQLGNGGQWEGWRYATSDEAVGLFQELGFTIGGSNGAIAAAPAGYSAALTSLGNLLGDTLGEYGNANGLPGYYFGAVGLTSQSVGPTSHKRLGAYTSQNAAYFYLQTSPSGACCVEGHDYGSLAFGHYLVRDPVAPVPIPAAAWLLLSGLAGMGFIGRRRKTT